MRGGLFATTVVIQFGDFGGEKDAIVNVNAPPLLRVKEGGRMPKYLTNSTDFSPWSFIPGSWVYYRLPALYNSMISAAERARL